MNWGFFLLRIAIGLSLVTLLYLSQRFWYRSLWRMTSHWGRNSLRIGTRAAYVLMLLLVIVTTAEGFSRGRGRIEFVVREAGDGFETDGRCWAGIGTTVRYAA